MEKINHTKQEAIEAMKILREFIPNTQIMAITNVMRGEEKQFFFNKAVEIAEIIKTIPKTYEQDEKRGQTITYLHYFRGNADWYITEKDADSPEDQSQCQAFGYADLGFGFGELGYISIVELVENNVELDLYFTPKPLSEIEGIEL